MRTLTALAVLVMLLLPAGCAAIVASMDTDAALSKAAKANLANIQTAAQDKANVHDDLRQRLDVELRAKLAGSTGGAQALSIYEAYAEHVGKMQEAKARDMAQYAVALDNATLIVELVERRIAIRAGWDSLLGRLPPVAALRDRAEVLARQYMAALSGAPIPQLP